MDYDDMLDRAIDQTPDSAGKTTRFNVPEPSITIEGSTTIYDNFEATADYISRDASELFKFFQDNLATSGSIEDERAVFKGEFRESRMQETLNEYVDGYVLCGECQSPDTYLTEQNGVDVIRCEACGAITPTTE